VLPIPAEAGTLPSLVAVHTEKQVARVVAEFFDRHVQVDIVPSGKVAVPRVFHECWNLSGSTPAALSHVVVKSM
jgi:hypothetical protein